MHNTEKVNLANVQMIAHRGVSGLERENTNAAFIAAGNRSYYGIETDVHRTKDGHYVIFHDDNMLRLTGISHTNCMTLVNMSGAWCRVPMVSRGPASPTCRVCSCCARSCLRAVSSPGMPYALPTTAMLWMQSSTRSLFPFFRSRAMASFANCSCSALAFSIVILNPPKLLYRAQPKPRNSCSSYLVH